MPHSVLNLRTGQTGIQIVAVDADGNEAVDALGLTVQLADSDRYASWLHSETTSRFVAYQKCPECGECYIAFRTAEGHCFNYNLLKEPVDHVRTRKLQYFVKNSVGPTCDLCGSQFAMYFSPDGIPIVSQLTGPKDNHEYEVTEVLLKEYLARRTRHVILTIQDMAFIPQIKTVPPSLGHAMNSEELEYCIEQINIEMQRIKDENCS